jgi:hypothetical protein
MVETGRAFRISHFFFDVVGLTRRIEETGRALHLISAVEILESLAFPLSLCRSDQPSLFSLVATLEREEGEVKNSKFQNYGENLDKIFQGESSKFDEALKTCEKELQELESNFRAPPGRGSVPRTSLHIGDNECM